MQKINLKLVTLIVLAGFMMAGCASSGNRSILKETSDTVAEKITKGKTTKDEVHAIYGDPLKTEFNANGDLMWTYSITKQKKVGGDFVVCLFTLGIVCKNHDDVKHLVVLFDKNNVVLNYDLTISETTFSTVN
jgi:outer membrane protein assembly factor BamE (lipoprotein component of BamABCDE complex)